MKKRVFCFLYIILTTLLLCSCMQKAITLEEIKNIASESDISTAVSRLDTFEVSTPQEAVELWAQAKTNNDGALKYALLCSDTKAEFLDAMSNSENMWQIYSENESRPVHVEYSDVEEIEKDFYIANLTNVYDDKTYYSQVVVIKEKKGYVVVEETAEYEEPME